MIKKNFICAFFACAFLSSAAFGLGVGVDAVQAGKVVGDGEVDVAKSLLDSKRTDLSLLESDLEHAQYAQSLVLIGNPQKTQIIVSNGNSIVSKGENLTKKTPEELARYIGLLKSQISEAQAELFELQENLDATKAANEEDGSLKVDPQVSIGKGDPSAKITFRYTYNFLKSSFFTSAVDIGASPDETPEKLAAGFATDGGNVDFSMGGGSVFSFGKNGVIEIKPSLIFTYSGFTASELDLEAGGTAEVDTEVQSTTVGVMIGFEEKYYLSFDTSYHEVSEDESEFSDLLDHERTSVVRAIFALDDKAERLLVLERANPIGKEKAQLRLSFITSLDF